jgi:hypothetical protein
MCCAFQKPKRTHFENVYYKEIINVLEDGYI